MRWLLAAALAAAVLRGANPSSTVVFDYGKHGQDWATGKCGSRIRQSPIDVPGDILNEPANGQLPLRYQAESKFLVVNNGHCIHVDMEDQGLGGLTFENAWFNILAANLHAPGEHTLSGARPGLELHLVHKRYDSDALAVLAVSFEGVPDTRPPPPAPPASNGTNGTNGSNATAAPVIAYTPPDPLAPGYTNLLEVFTERATPDIDRDVMVVVPWDMNALVAGTYVSYDGSLTAPPCSENVRWFVRQHPIKASAEQVKRLTEASMKMSPQGNWRAVLPVQGRPLSVVQTIATEPALTAQGPVASPAAGNTLAEDAAMQWGFDATSQAMAHLAHIKNLDQRLRSAADAHALGLQPEKPSHLVPECSGPDCAPAADKPLYSQSAIANGLAQSINKAVDDSVKNLVARIHPGRAAQEEGALLRGHLAAGDAAGKAVLQAAGVVGA